MAKKRMVSPKGTQYQLRSQQSSKTKLWTVNYRFFPCINWEKADGAFETETLAFESAKTFVEEIDEGPY
jgi:hypothetical protein